MPKRKLSDIVQSSRSPEWVRLAHMFDQGVNTLARALKMVRGFERQKLSRREQKAKSEKDSKMLARIRGEIDALKSFEYCATAEKYLFKQLVKTKRIADSQAFYEFKRNRNIAVAGPKSAAEVNVAARLFKARLVHNTVITLLGSIRELLGLEDAPAGDKRGKHSVEKRDKESKEVLSEKAEEIEVEKWNETDRDGDSGEWKGVATDGSFESEDYSHLSSRLAPSSDSGSVSGPEDLHGGDSDSDSDDGNSTSGRKPKSIAKRKSPAAAIGTTFLPSLSMGGYISGSESEAEDDTSTPRRKNRMGQQARRALWEKKYGSQANHVKKQKIETQANRDSGWDLRRGAIGPEGDKRKKTMKGRARSDGGKLRHNPVASAKGKAQDDNKPLHPSWEAKRKLKEQQQQPMAAFQGKKVTFD